MQYSLLLINQEASDVTISPEVMAETQAAFSAYGKALVEAGVLVAANILRPTSASTTVTLRNGRLEINDGPFADTKEKLAGTFVIEVPDLDAALAWAEKCPATQYGVVEVRPSAIIIRDGEWTDPS